jgi:hypothetical protein
MYMHSYKYGFFVLFWIISSYFNYGTWWRDVIREATLKVCIHKRVQAGLSFGFYSFIVSEVCSFLDFSGLFHSALSPAIAIGVYGLLGYYSV